MKLSQMLRALEHVLYPYITSFSTKYLWNCSKTICRINCNKICIFHLCIINFILIKFVRHSIWTEGVNLSSYYTYFVFFQLITHKAKHRQKFYKGKFVFSWFKCNISIHALDSNNFIPFELYHFFIKC